MRAAMMRRPDAAGVDGRRDPHPGRADKLDAMTYRSATRTAGRTYDFKLDRDDLGRQRGRRPHEAERARQLAKIGKPVDRDDWQMAPVTVNAYYDPQLNGMVVPGRHPPAAVLQPARVALGQLRRDRRRWSATS